MQKYTQKKNIFVRNIREFDKLSLPSTVDSRVPLGAR